MRNSIFFTFIVFGIFNVSFLTLPTRAEDINVNSFNYSINKEDEDYKEINLKKSKTNNRNKYLVGSGDIITIKIYGYPLYTGNYKVLNDGWISLPVIGNYFIENKTLDEASKELADKFSKELIVPDIHLSLYYSRPLNIAIIGEVQKPGLYKIENILGKMDPPRVVDGLQLAGGITSKSNLEEVKLIRVFKENGELIKKVTSLNLKSLLEDGDQVANIKLNHGDVIKINSTNSPSQAQYKLAKITLASSKIGITVVGEVKNPGEKQVFSGVTLFEAIMIAGGPIDWQANKQNIQLIREDKNGVINVSKFKYDIKNNTIANNPILIEGDIINVNTVNYTKFSRGLANIIGPLRDVITAVTFYKLTN